MSKLPYAGPGGLKVKDKIQVEVKISIDAEHLWDSTLEVYSTPWVRRIITDGYESGEVEIWIDDPNWDDGQYKGELPDFYWSWWDLPEDYKKASTLQKTFTINDMTTALQSILSKNLHHCGTAVEPNPEEWDACCADYMIQYMFFDKLIYG